MEKIVECVPNFSEGRNSETLARLVEVIDSVANVAVLGTHADADHNRSVVTFVGEPAAVVEAALRAARVAVESIDLRQHAGQHPRIGALDVLPFVPVRGVTLEECIGLAHEAGERIWDELGVPVYFYESAARKPDRVNLEDVRRKGFEQLREEIATLAEREPDVGDTRVHESAGATIVGARSFLIAYNINLNTTDQQIARRVAAAVRGRDGGLRYLKALGFALPERGLTQVSMNLVRFERTQLHQVFEAVKREAERWGVSVAGSEIVGLVPQAAIDGSAEYFLRVENFSPELILENRIAAALARKSDATTQRRDDATATKDESETSAHFASAVSSEAIEASSVSASAHPRVSVSPSSSSNELVGDVAGGGAAAARAAALSAALGEMVARLVERKAGQEDAGAEARDCLQELAELRARLSDAIEEDEAAFAEVLGARRMPRGNDEERRAREVAVEAALKGAANVPLEVARDAVRVGEILETLAELGDPAWLSDAATGAQLAQASVAGARYNVLVNIGALEDDEFATEHRARADDLLERAREIASRVEAMLTESIS
ncbi:MAG: glutamate formiminotransferase / formiminotetrahydrofolate cyclodeaminase [Acidobacteriota bacterium]|nr:glutamate formiminotransferase / formiminotetrahydrofolate cyclodeaminase [Acidobacteriota bacterium]